MGKKTGIYICSGCGIDKTIDLDTLKDFIEEDLNYEALEFNSLVCGDFVNQIKADIADKGLNRIIIGACSGRYFADHFDFGSEVLVERVALREWVAWTQDPKDYEETVEEHGWDDNEHPIHELAADYLRMAAAKIEHSAPLEPIDEDVTKKILVVGGGVAGMSAALASANAGYEVVLVEKAADLGGWAKEYKWVFPSTPPFLKPVASPVGELIEQVTSHSKITVHTSSMIAKTLGQPGQFDITITNSGSDSELRVGAIIQATGHTPYDASKLADKFGYGTNPNIVTNLDIEKMVSNGGIARPSDGQAPKSVAIVHCAGSRDQDHLGYCSAVCCRTALKQALYVREQLPETDVFLLYKDIRSPGVYEQFYEAVQQHEGIYLTKGEVVQVTGDEAEIKVDLEDTLLGESISVNADLLVLATGIVPSLKVDGEYSDLDPLPEEITKELKEGDEKEEKPKFNSQTLNLHYMQGPDLPKLKYGFPDSHFICFPYETRRTGIYTAGTVRAPMDIAAACNDGYGAALKAMQVLEMTDQGLAVHPRSGDASIPEFFLQRCTQCKRCTQECPFGTLDEDEKGTPKPNPTRCRRCGICMGACPERIISFKNFSPQIISQVIKDIEIPDEDEEKPRILCFMCENDAIPALDIAALHRVKLPSTIRVVSVRCLGSVNTIWLADALSNGFDGIMLLGCQRGDDYQCHYIKGSELAKTRMKNVKEKLEQLVLEPERIKIESVEISDWERVTQLFNEFAEEIEEMDPNPYKGF